MTWRPARPVALMTALVLASAACSASATDGPASERSTLSVVTTFSILEDIVITVGGDAVDVHSIVPRGTDPHEYQPLPDDVRHTADADVIVWNGLNLELGDGWFDNLLEVAGRSLTDDDVVEASTGIEPMYLTGVDGDEHEVNPHAFLDPNVGMVYVENIRDGLVAADPANETGYAARAEDYLARLADLDDLYVDTVQGIDPANRILVTSENAFQYLADRYGLAARYIWEIDTGDLGSPEQVSTLIQQLRANPPPALFVESNVDTRPMETVSDETGIPIAGKLFSDELGDPRGTGGTYLTMLRSNIDQIGAGLGSGGPHDE